MSTKRSRKIARQSNFFIYIASLVTLGQGRLNRNKLKIQLIQTGLVNLERFKQKKKKRKNRTTILTCLIFEKSLSA
jgi:hypothetical protein